MFKFLNKYLHTPVWLFIILSVVLILRIPSFFEPYSYGDEMIYLVLGEGIRQGIPLYSGIHDNKPPLLYIAAALAGNLFWFKAILAIWNLLTIFIFWKLTSVIFPYGSESLKGGRLKSQKPQIIATSIFALLTTIPLLEGNIVNAELFMLGTTVLGFYILLTGKLTVQKLIISGVLFATSALFKIPAIFDIPAIIVYWIVLEKKLNKKSILVIFKNSLVLILAFLTPILLSFLWYYIQGSFKEYFVAAFAQNVGYLSSWRPGDVQKPFLVKNAPLLLRFGIVAISIFLLFKVRAKISKKFIFVCSWLLLSLLGATLSERPYPHYLIQSVPAISLVVSVLITAKGKEQVYAIIPLLFASFVPFYYKYYYYDTFSYYQRFIKLSTHQITKEEYFKTYGDQVPRNYKIANLLAASTKPYEKIFVWGDGVPVYALSKRLPPGKYVADYHIKEFSSNKETINSLSRNTPSFIVILPNTETFPELEYFISKNYGLADQINGALIWKLFSPQVRSLISP